MLAVVIFLTILANIEEGNSSSTSTVETTISGSGNVYTRIEVQANNQKKVLEASQPGTYQLKVSSSPASTDIGISTTIQDAPPPKPTDQHFSLNQLITNILKFIFSLKLTFQNPWHLVLKRHTI